MRILDFLRRYVFRVELYEVWFEYNPIICYGNDEEVDFEHIGTTLYRNYPNIINVVNLYLPFSNGNFEPKICLPARAVTHNINVHPEDIIAAVFILVSVDHKRKRVVYKPIPSVYSVRF